MDKFVAALYRAPIRQDALADALSLLPARELRKLAMGDSNMGGWLSQFEGSSLHGQALALLEQELQLESQTAQVNQPLDQLRMKKKLLELELARQQSADRAQDEGPTAAPAGGQGTSTPDNLGAPASGAVKTSGAREPDPEMVAAGMEHYDRNAGNDVLKRLAIGVPLGWLAGTGVTMATKPKSIVGGVAPMAAGAALGGIPAILKAREHDKKALERARAADKKKEKTKKASVLKEAFGPKAGGNIIMDLSAMQSNRAALRTKQSSIAKEAIGTSDPRMLRHLWALIRRNPGAAAGITGGAALGGMSGASDGGGVLGGLSGAVLGGAAGGAAGLGTQGAVRSAAGARRAVAKAKKTGKGSTNLLENFGDQAVRRGETFLRRPGGVSRKMGKRPPAPKPIRKDTSNPLPE